MNNINFKEAKRNRNELELPTLHFIVFDDWIDVIGEKALFSWLKMYTFCDRSQKKINEKEEKINAWEQSVIPTSLKHLRKKLKVGNDTFYNKILKPLWNVGLIDIEEFKESKSKGSKPLNIIVYKYPQNDFSLAVQPLKKIRDYDKDYSSYAKRYGGGRPKKNKQAEENNQVRSLVANGFLGGGILLQNREVFSYRIGGYSLIEYNNRLNNITNGLNSITNNLDTTDTDDELSKSQLNNENYQKQNILQKKEQEFYLEKAFNNNYVKIPKKISNVLNVFTSSRNEANHYYSIILQAKKNVQDELNVFIWLDQEDDLMEEIENTFVRSIKKINYDENIINKDGYLYKSIFQTIFDFMKTNINNNSQNDTEDIYYNWLDE